MIKLKTDIFSRIAVNLFIGVLFFSCSSDFKETADKNKETITNSTQVSDQPDVAKSKLNRQNKIRESLKKVLGAKYDLPLTKATTKQILKGAEVYKLKCAKCHGKKGKGNGPYGLGLRITPADLTDAKLAFFYSDEARKQIIRKGIVGTTMIAWDRILSEQEINDVYAFIKQFVVEDLKKQPVN